MKYQLTFFLLLVTLFVKGQKIELIESFIGYTNKSEIISFTPNPKLIISGDYEGGLNLWDLEKQKLLKTIHAHIKPINNITFHPQKNIFLTCSQDSTIKLWSLHSNRLIDSLKINDIPTLAIFNEKRNTYFICTEKGQILEKNTKRRKATEIINIETVIQDAIFSFDKQHIITCDKESIKKISLENGTILNELKNPYSSQFLKVDIYTGDTLIAWSDNGMISYWDLNQNNILTEIRAKNAYNKFKRTEIRTKI